MDDRPQDTTQEPGSPRPWWRDARKVVPVAVLAVAIVAAGVAWAVLAGRDRPVVEERRPPAVTTTTPPSAPVTTAPEPTASVPPTQSAEPTLAPKPRPRVAYRLEDAVWVADEDGTSPVLVAKVPDGPFSLSPDGETLAVVDGASGMLWLVPVSTRKKVVVGPALPERPSWAPSSSWLAYTAGPSGGGEVRTVSLEGTPTTPIASGRAPKVSRDGGAIAFLAGGSAGQAGALMLSIGGAGPVPVPGAEQAVDVAWGSGGLYFSTDMGQTGGSEVRAYRAGQPATRLVGPREEDPPTVFAGLLVSPAADRLLFAAAGDDGFSRLFTAEASGTVTPVPSRYDAYPVGWSSDGARILFVEGNEFQGEATRLVSALPDGSDRRVLVPGAGR